jgi:anti-sigma regulatory factor (Ser/Thr protein kinase)
MRTALLPRRFPVRRDVDVRADASRAEGQMSFSDAFWPDQRTLAVTVARIGGGGLDAVQGAVAFRQTLRAAIEVEPTPQAALSLCLSATRLPDVSAALMRLDVDDGTLSVGTIGNAYAQAAAGTGIPSTLEPGGIVRLTAGEVAFAEGGETGIDALMAGARFGARGGCAAAVLFKAPKRTATAATFSLPNDHAAIPGLLGEVQHFLAHGAVAEDDTAGLDVALDEILSNAIAYAFRDGTAHEILVAPTLSGDRLTIEIRDDGAPFDPLRIPAPDLSDDLDGREIGGLGMHFVRTVVDDVAYRRCEGWNVLTLGKRLSRANRLQEARS